MKQTLFTATKQFINSIPKGQTFTSKQYIDAVGDYEQSTHWKNVNSRHYRSHTYKTYLKRSGFLTSIKRGTWRVENHIPPQVTLGTVEFLIGYDTYYKDGEYKRKFIYNNYSKEEWKDLIEKFNNKFKTPHNSEPVEPKKPINDLMSFLNETIKNSSLEAKFPIDFEKLITSENNTEKPSGYSNKELPALHLAAQNIFIIFMK
jgi:hypothetical protein